jgi:hypothetical protein
MAGMNFSADRLRLKAELIYSRQGALPFVAALLLLLTILFGVLVVPGQIAAKENAEQTLDKLKQQQLNMRLKPDLRLSPAQSLTRVLADPQTSNAQIRTLLDFAASNGVNVMQADYRRVAEAHTTDNQVAYSQLQIALPVKADYPSLRRFIYSALAGMPALSLDQLIIKREQANSGQVDAQLVLSLWQKAPRVTTDGLAAGDTN